MIATLADLVAPMSEEAFVALLRERRPILQRGAGVGRYAALIDWDGLLQAIFSGAYPTKTLRVTQRGSVLPGVFYCDGGEVAPERLQRLMTGGASIVAYGLEDHLPNFTQLCAAVAARLGENIGGAVIATTGAGGALPRHYDPHDLVVLQIEGEKRWIIDSEPQVDPVRGMASTLEDPRTEPLLDIILQPGDFLFLPAGYRHRCENHGVRSLHAGIAFGPITVPRVFELLLREAIADRSLHRPVRVDPADRPAAELALKDILLRRIQDLSLEELVAAHIEAPF